MWYKLDLSDYEPREVRNYLEFTEYKFSPYQLEAIQKELDNFKDSFGKEWKAWELSDLKYRLENNWTFYLIGSGRTGEIILEGWAFIDWNHENPKLCKKYVVPKYRGTGLNLDLIWIRCNELVKKGYKEAIMHISDWNKPAQKGLDEKIFTEIKDI
tara:strand:+ start:626 stop:1093 length:468 start_codon:yes stop_codon:yes gene_type:complete